MAPPTVSLALPPALAARTRIVRDGAVLVGLLFAVWLFAFIAPAVGTFGFDAYAYWSVDLGNLYGTAQGTEIVGAFRYSPAAAQLLAPIVHAVPFWQFLTLWLALLAGTIVWLGGNGRRALLLLAFPPVALELYHANIHLLIAAVIVIGFRYPAAWSFVLLTKVTPGVGLLWFAVRREWRQLGVALGVTAAVAAVSFVIAPHLWSEWITSLTRTTELSTDARGAIAISPALRIPVAAAVVAWGARTDRRWTVAVAATLAMPVLWPSALATLVAVPVLRGGWYVRTTTPGALGTRFRLTPRTA